MDPALLAALSAALGSTVARTSHEAGGDINESYCVTLADGKRVFVKTNRSAPPDMFASEARGLGWLAEAGALRVPTVLAVSSEQAQAPHFLVLEYMNSARRVNDFDERLGRGLAALHRSGPNGFGLDHHNYIGRLPQDNTPEPDWVEFYRQRRLEPQVARAARAGLLSASTRRRFELLYARLATLVGEREPPARLHGDLWGGNLHVDDQGMPALIDPAVYGGHREMDLAMMRLFGGFGERVFAAYQEAWPLAPGHRERVLLYQLYPLLVHVNLFGAGYVGSVERALDTYV